VGNCRYCHQNVGLFAAPHRRCVMEANERIESIENCMAYAVTHSKPYSEVSSMVEKRTADFDIPHELIRAALKNGWSKGAEQRCKAQPISDSEASAISDLYRAAGFTNEEMRLTAGDIASVLSYLIWTVLHDQIYPYQEQISFNLQTGEIPVFGLANVLVGEHRTVSSYVGSYAGASARVASGVYYHLGGARGHRVQNTSLQEVDYGDFLITTRAVYFGGTEKGINFRLGYANILRFSPYSDAVGICRDGGREQIFSPRQLANSGWWMFNMLQALAAKDSAARASADSN
jgi:hypothetical protein